MTENTYDILIKNGQIINGLGDLPYEGNVAIKNKKIVALGDCVGEATQIIDAKGCIVTPGFVDIHTHYDGQMSWDEEISPSVFHGVTTCVMGSCGVGFAPAKKEDHQKLIDLMEGVEDIPGAALAEGIRWNWETFPEYMQALDSQPHTIDFLALVPHDPIRVYVMGERAIADEAATDDDIQKMRSLVKEALDAGAIGFSTGRTDNHRSVHGEETPASVAAVKELTGIAKAFVDAKHGVLNAVSDFDMAQGPDKFDAEFDVLEEMAKAAQRPLSMSTMQRDGAPDQWQKIMARVSKANENGLVMKSQVAARAIGMMLGLNATFHPFVGFPSFKKISQLSLAEQVEKMRNPQFKKQLLSEKSEPLAGDGSSVPPLADYFLSNLDILADRLYFLGEVPNYEPSISESIGAAAKKSGEDIMSVIYDALLEQDGKALLYFPIMNYLGSNLDNVQKMIAFEHSLPGLSDGGAHVGTVCDSSFPTYMIMHWARDRKHGKFPLEEIIKKQTHDTSRFIGLKDRGTLEVGMKADVNVIDYDNLALKHPQMRKDLPAGGQRLLQEAVGYKYTIVSGEVIAQDGKITNARPGHLVRSKPA